MVIDFLDGNLFESDSQTLVNPINCHGIIERGIALKFKKKYPLMFEDYVKRCYEGGVQVGKPYLFREKDLQIVNFPIKIHWQDPPKLDYINEGLHYLTNHYKEWGITSLAMPALGCGLGGLDWNAVSILYVDILGTLDIPVSIYLPVVGYKGV